MLQIRQANRVNIFNRNDRLPVETKSNLLREDADPVVVMVLRYFCRIVSPTADIAVTKGFRLILRKQFY